jgi:hypothetical protein
VNKSILWIACTIIALTAYMLRWGIYPANEQDFTSGYALDRWTGQIYYVGRQGMVKIVEIENKHKNPRASEFLDGK